MVRFNKSFLLIFLVAALVTSCRKKAFDEYYGRPDTLAQPIYQQLKARGNFTSLLACIDKAGYKDILSAAGFWTMFASNDSAFNAFFAQRGIQGVAQIDSGTAKQIVTYSLVYNSFPKARMADFQANTGWVSNTAFRRRTAYYTGFYPDTNTVTKEKITALGSNRNNTNGSNFFVFGDNNNKSIPYFLTSYITNKGLSAQDYNYFYPNTTFTGFNVVDAAVINADIVAENGYIHEVNKVLLPLPNIDQYLSSNPQYSEFKALFDKYMVQYFISVDATNRYKILTGQTNNIYIKSFNNTLAFSPNNENYLKLQDNDAQTDSWTMFVPRNDVFRRYRDSVLLENYTSFDQMPLQIITDFLNAHMWQTSVWPSKFATTNNFQAEPARFDRNAYIIDKKILSNGIFYGTSKVQQANVFSTVYRRAYLDPRYSLMTRALDMNFKFNITVPTLKYAVFMMSDDLLKRQGFNFSIANNVWTYTPPGSTTAATSNAARDMLQRILATHIVPTPNGELDNLMSGASGIIETINGEYIRYGNGIVNSGGTLNNGPTTPPFRATGMATSINGPVYYGDNLLMYDTTTVGNNIVKLGSATTSNFNYFYQFLRNSALFTTTPTATSEITAITPGVFYTVFVPTNAAIQAAVTDGLLPKLPSGLPNFAPTIPTERDLVADFIRFHIMNKTTVVPDGKKAGSFETLYKNKSGDPTVLKISGALNSMQVKDNFDRTANVVINSSNNLSNRCVIHLIDNYLQYNPN